MPSSNEWTHWHLTPRGWERGSTRTDHDGITERPDPEGAVMLCIYFEEISSPYSMAIEKKLEIRWTSDDVGTVAALLAKYGECFPTL